MSIPIAAVIVRVLWLVVEYPLVSRYRIKILNDQDKHSAKLWDIANLLEPVGLILGFIGFGQIVTADNLNRPAGLILLITGIIIRFSAIRTLGKYFTSTVVIRNDHQLIRSGLYKHIRHPAYTGAILAHLGLGLSFSNWFSLALSSLPYLVAAFYRMHVEDQALQAEFGTEYTDYSATTKRLIPKLY
jgi:protein-S-isoprenylcysteine O-methyltransferase Ste14